MSEKPAKKPAEPQAKPAPTRARIRAKRADLAGLCLYGRNVTAEGFDLDVTGWTEKQVADLCGDPNVAVDLS